MIPATGAILKARFANCKFVEIVSPTLPSIPSHSPTSLSFKAPETLTLNIDPWTSLVDTEVTKLLNLRDLAGQLSDGFYSGPRILRNPYMVLDIFFLRNNMHLILPYLPKLAKHPPQHPLYLLLRSLINQQLSTMPNCHVIGHNGALGLRLNILHWRSIGYLVSFPPSLQNLLLALS